jgi:hypothetical protein
MKLEFTKDICGNEILQDITGRHQVMMEWERPYMEKCIEFLEPSGSVLEIGFGMGFSAGKLCSYEDVTEYTVIECSPVVWEKFETFKKELKKERPELKINIVKGRWEDLLCECKIYDRVFFDDYSGINSYESYTRFNKFLYEIVVNKHTKKGTRIGVYSTNPMNLSVSILSISNHRFDIEIPQHCKYARGNKMSIPIIEQLVDFNDDYKEEFKKILYSNLPFKKLKLLNKPKKCTCNTIIINNFYSNVDSTRQFMRSTQFIDNYSKNSFINDQIKQHIQGYLNNFSNKITNFNNLKNGRCKIQTEDSKIICNREFKWRGILFLTPNPSIDSGIEIYEYNDDNLHETGEVSKDLKITDTIGNIYNRLVLIPSFINYKLKGKCFIQEFYFDTEN